MRYFIRTETGEKGPYELELIRESIRAGRLSFDAQVRPEDEDAWKPLSEVLRSGRRTVGGPMQEAAGPGQLRRDVSEPNASSTDRGSFLLGFIAGLLGGCVVLALVLRRGKPDTRAGVLGGFGAQVVILLLIGLSRP